MTTADPTTNVARRSPSSHRVAGPYRHVRLAVDGQVAHLTLDRPHKRNALSMAMSDELIHALETLRDDASVKIVVLRGAGGNFCSGDDIGEMGQWGDANDVMRRVRGYQHMADTLERLDKMTVAAVEGFAVGGGLELTMACDFVVAAESSRWGMPEIDVGITPGWGGTTRMSRLIGRRMTKEINIIGALHPARRAAELGLWNRVVGDTQLDTALDTLVDVLLTKNQQAARQLKFIINAGVEADLHTAQAFEELCAGLTASVNGLWQVVDADRGAGQDGFVNKNDLWQTRRNLARNFWTDRPAPSGESTP